MAHGAFLYLVDGDRDSRRELAGRLATRGIETWPFDTAAGFLQLLDKLRPSRPSSSKLTARLTDTACSPGSIEVESWETRRGSPARIRSSASA
jgi:hypothetical protein